VDFMVTGFMVSRSVQVSYAVGEWARVWPLEHLFKSFGSYFVRRGEKDALYHRTLEAYIRLITKERVTQAIFPEGGLSRDGLLRPVKLGLLDMMTKAKTDPDFRAPLVFIPVGINIDRVVEDEVLTTEHLGEHPYKMRGPWQKTKRLFTLLWSILVGVPIQIGRFFVKRLKKHGIVAIHFGKPVVFDDWYAKQKPFLAEADRAVRWEKLRPFAADLLQRIGHNIPVTPVTLACMAAAKIGEDAMTKGVERGTFLLAMRSCLESLQKAKAPFAISDPYTGRREGRMGVAEMTDAVDAADDLERVLARALDVTTKRGILRCNGSVRVLPGRWSLVQYYANSLQSHFTKSNS